MKKQLYLFLLVSIVLVACSKNDVIISSDVPTDYFYETEKGQTPINIITSTAISFVSPKNLISNYVPFDGIATYNETIYEADPKNTENPAAHDEYNLKVSVPTGNNENYVTINDTIYYLKQFHFHWKSEHQINGKSSEMEVHLVHQSNKGKYAVLGVLINVGSPSSILQGLFDASPKAKGVSNTISRFNPLTLLPTDATNYFTYSGSLTTPGGGISVIPYYEGLKWFVYKNPVTISEAQFTQYKSIYPEHNARPVQPIGGRKVYYRTN